MGWHLPRRTRAAGGLHVLCGGCFVEWGDGGEEGECHTRKIKDKREKIKDSIVFFAPALFTRSVFKGECDTCKIKDKSSALSLSKWEKIKGLSAISNQSAAADQLSESRF